MAESQPKTLSAPTAEASFPPGLHNTFLFSGFNALSYPLVLSSPMVLYARSLGASATVLGIIAGMMPLLVIFQIPAANHIARVGFKRFVYAGWGTRVMFIFGMALVPLTGRFLDAKNRLGLMLMLLFGFNLSRGISSCAWLPWITLLVPPGLRGKYLARDAAVQNSANFVTFLIAAACLAGEPRPWQFAAALVLAAFTVHAARNGIWLLLFVAAPAACALRTAKRPPAAVSHGIALALAACAVAGLVRGPLEIGASRQLVAQAITVARPHMRARSSLARGG